MAGPDNEPLASMTRRGWMLTVGQTAAGLGLVDITTAARTGKPQLPPGVYLASTDHLSHALMSAEGLHPVPAGCPTDYVEPRTGPYEPKYFSPAQFAVVRRVTELILAEETELANEIAEWIDLRVWVSAPVREAALQLNELHRAVALAYHGTKSLPELDAPEAQMICRDGLAWLSETTKFRYRTDFLSLSPTQQITVLDSISDERTNRSENSGIRVFDFLKSEAIRGFYTSRIGLKELDYKGNAFYASSPGCKHA